jgi:predicted PurR-regulated permease PerM
MIQVRLSHLLAIVGFFVTFYLLTALSDILLPFALGFALAYFLDPLADRLEAVGVRRSLATLTITVIVGLALLTALAFGLPVLAQQISMLIAALPGYISDVQVWLLEQNLVEGQNELVSVMGESLLAGLQKTASSMVLTGLSLINLLALIFITPIVAVYMLNDWDHMIARINGLLPEEQAAIIRNLASQIDETLGGFALGKFWFVSHWARFMRLACRWSGCKAALLSACLPGSSVLFPMSARLLAWCWPGRWGWVNLGLNCRHWR